MIFPELRWLPPMPDWRDALRAAKAAGGERAWAELVHLANVRIDASAAVLLGCANPAPFNLPAHASRTNVICVASLASS